MDAYNPAGIFLKKSEYKVAAYCRISREDGDGESNSISTQKKLLQDFILCHNDMKLHDIYCDDGFTGTNFNRPEFQRMMSDIDSGKVDTVIVKDLSRFGRSYIDAGKYLERVFPEKQIRFIAINDGIDNLTQAYDISMPIKNMINETYARDISNKVQSAFKTKQRHGDFIGAFAGYGYKKDSNNHNKLVIDTYAAEIVKRIYDMYLSGYGKIRIAKILNEEKVLCPSEYKKSKGLRYNNGIKLDATKYWTYATIHRILTNEMYIGNMVQNKYFRSMHGKAKKLPKSEWIIVKDTHPAIIDRQTWDRVQTIMKSSTKDIDFTAEKNMFAGKLKCGDCGRSMAKTRWKTKKSTRTYFSCGSYKRYGKGHCSPHTIYYEVIEEIVLNDINGIISKITNLKELAKEKEKDVLKEKAITDDKIRNLEKELEKINRDKLSSYQDYKDAVLTKEDYIAYSKLCEERIKSTEVILEKLKTEKEGSNKTEKILENPWITNLVNTGRINKLDRDVLDIMVDKIYVYEDKTIKIVYNFSDELKKLSVQD